VNAYGGLNAYRGWSQTDDSLERRRIAASAGSSSDAVGVRVPTPSASVVVGARTSRPADSGKIMCPAPAHFAIVWHRPSAPRARTPCASSTKTTWRCRRPQSMSSRRHVHGANDASSSSSSTRASSDLSDADAEPRRDAAMRARASGPSDESFDEFSFSFLSSFNC
jgi:hypothetical protein